MFGNLIALVETIEAIPPASRRGAAGARRERAPRHCARASRAQPTVEDEKQTGTAPFGSRVRRCATA
jgi:hypothetical protein